MWRTSSAFSVEPFSACLGFASFSVSEVVFTTAKNGFDDELAGVLLVASSVVLPTWKEAGLRKLDLADVEDDEDVAAAKPDCKADGRSILDFIGFEREIEFPWIAAISFLLFSSMYL